MTVLRLVASFALVAWTGCSGAPQPTSAADHTQFDFATQSPLEFLDFLREGYARVAMNPTPTTRFYAYSVSGPLRGWIKASDLPGLRARLDDTQPCLAVVSELCSFLPTSPSTVGREAAFLIEGYHAEQTGTGYGGYPPWLSSQ